MNAGSNDAKTARVASEAVRYLAGRPSRGRVGDRLGTGREWVVSGWIGGGWSVIAENVQATCNGEWARHKAPPVALPRNRVSPRTGGGGIPSARTFRSCDRQT